LIAGGYEGGAGTLTVPRVQVLDAVWIAVVARLSARELAGLPLVAGGSVSIPDGQAVEPGLLLFACFVVRQLAVNAANDSAAGSTAAVSNTSG